MSLIVRLLVDTMLGSLYIYTYQCSSSLSLFFIIIIIYIRLSLQITNFRKQLPIAKFTHGSFHSLPTFYLTAATMVNQGNSSSPLSSSRQTSPKRLTSEDPSRSKCSCGTGDGTGDYIECDNETCKVGWYHWECVQVTEHITGTWLCPNCSPSAAFYIKQLVKRPAAPSPVPKVEKAGTPAGSIGKRREQGSAASSAASIYKKTAERANLKRGQQEQEQETVLETKSKEEANKGVAVKKPAAKKPKAKWIGWVEMTSDGEEEFKKTVDAQWSVEDAVLGKRTRASKAMGEDNETGSRMSGRNLRRKIIKTDSDESIYQEEDKEKEEVRVQMRASAIEIQSNDSNDSEDTMDLDEGARHADKDSADELIDPSTNSGEKRQFSPGLVRRDSTSNRAGQKKVIEVETEDLEDSMDMSFQDEDPEIGGSDPSDGSEYVDDKNSSASTEILVTTSTSREVIDSQGPPPQSSQATDQTGPSISSPILQVSEPAARHEGALDISAENEGLGNQDESITTPAVDFATLYKRQGNCWGEFPESAIRSTLLRLG